MKNTIFVFSLALAVTFVLGVAIVQSQTGGNGYSYGMGPGYGYGYGMGTGMMGGYYGSDTGRGYGWHYQSTSRAINAKEAEAMMKDYMNSSRNHHSKLGKINDTGDSFEAEILTKNNNLVDRIHIDKATGYISSAY